LNDRFVDTAWVNEHEPSAIRLFRTGEVERYNNERIRGPDVQDHVAKDEYNGYRTNQVLNNARGQMHKK